MNDKDLWLTVRRALLMICKAIENKYSGKVSAEEQIIELDETATISFPPDE